VGLKTIPATSRTLRARVEVRLSRDARHVAYRAGRESSSARATRRSLSNRVVVKGRGHGAAIKKQDCVSRKCPYIYIKNTIQR